MMILVSKTPTSLGHVRTPNLGILARPNMGMLWSPLPDWYWACDNGAFSGFDEKAFVDMLERAAATGGCKWVAAPDVVGDAVETLELFTAWHHDITEGYGLPIALVAQDGLTFRHVPWGLLDCLFVGGTTEWKLGVEARLLVREAKARGKLVHMGRVNSHRRLRLAKSWGVDSVDGSGYSRFTNTHLPKALAFAAGDAQGSFHHG